jgi:hypothetical protein
LFEGISIEKVIILIGLKYQAELIRPKKQAIHGFNVRIETGRTLLNPKAGGLIGDTADAIAHHGG